SLVAQWLGLHVPSAGGPCLIPAQGTRSCMPAAAKVHMPQLRRPHATTKEPKCRN
ncbi:hypothetical protein DBR06_SOUSAS710185, partial [Sousa chinensis]